MLTREIIYHAKNKCVQNFDQGLGIVTSVPLLGRILYQVISIIISDLNVLILALDFQSEKSRFTFQKSRQKSTKRL